MEVILIGAIVVLVSSVAMLIMMVRPSKMMREWNKQQKSKKWKRV